MRIIHFSPAFDKQIYRELEPASAGKLYVGTSGLRDYFETQLGLTGRYPKENKRHRLYREALEAATSEKSFYNDSLKADPTRTAAELIRWRDELIMGGCDFSDVKQKPKRISDLFDVEKQFTSNPYFEYADEADRWRMVVSALKEKQEMPELTVFIEYPPELLEGSLKEILQVMDEHPDIQMNTYAEKKPDIKNEQNDLGLLKLKLQNMGADPVRLQGDGSVMIIQTPDLVDGAHFLMHYLRERETDYVIVGSSKTNFLATAMTENGLPSPSIQSAPPEDTLMQLLKLVPACIWKPLDVKRLLELLMFPESPLNRSLTGYLAGVVASKPGRLSDDWESAKERWCEKQEKVGRESKDIRKALDRVQFWLEHKLFSENDTAAKERAMALYRDLGKWANMKAAMLKNQDADELPYLRLAGVCSELIESLKNTTRPLTRLFLDQLVMETIYADDITIKIADKDSPEHVDNGFAISQPLNEIIYWNCTQSSASSKLCWLPEELSWLQYHDIPYQDPEKQSRAVFEADMQCLVNSNERLMIILPEIIDGEEVEAGNLISWIDGVSENIHKIFYQIPDELDQVTLLSMVETEFKTPLKLPQKSKSWKIQNRDLVQPRELESFSSLEKLFYYPYSWLLNYSARIRPAYTISSANENALKGTLAHSLIEKIVKSTENPFKISASQLKQKIGKLFDELMEKEGAFLLLPEMQKELSYFRYQIEQAILFFIKTCQENGWTSIRFEENFNGLLGDVPVASRADILLEKKDEKAVVDMKYIPNKKYASNLQEDKDLQLVLYAGLVASYEHMAHSAYYIISTQQFWAKNGQAFKDAEILGGHGDAAIAANREIWKKMIETYAYRLKEIKEKGKIEVADGLDATTLHYYQDLESEAYNLLDLPLYKNKKAENRYNDYINLIEVN